MNIRIINRKIQAWLRGKRIAWGKMIWDRKEIKIPQIEIGKINRVLFLRYDGKIGDMIINTLMFREIKKVYPDMKIGVVVAGINGEIIKNNPYVDKLYYYEIANIQETITEIQQEGYDLLIDFSEILKVPQIKFINLCRAKQNMGFKKDNWQLFDISIDYLPYDEHITKRYQKVLEYLEIKSSDLSYDIFLSKKDEQLGFEFRKSIAQKYLIVLNPYGASKHRTFNKEKLLETTREILSLSETIALSFVFPPEKLKHIREITNELNHQRVYICERANSVLASASLIKNADLVISPDTSIIHIAVAFERKLIGIYRPDLGEEKIALIWGPNSPRAVQIFSEVKNTKECLTDINSFSIPELKAQIREALTLS